MALLSAAPVVLLVRALRPLVVIRFGRLPSTHIGHFAGDTEAYLCKRDAGLHGRRTFDIFYHTSPVCNHQLKKMWDRTLNVCSLARWVDWANRWLPGGQSHVIPWPYGQYGDVHTLLARTQPHLSFTPDEECLGRVGLRELGVPDGKPFVCFHARDSAYLDSIFPGKYMDEDYRDSNIHNCIPAAEELARRGYYAIRMGVIVKEALNTSNPRIIDYASSGSRTDFLDIFLWAHCHFFIGSNTGISSVPVIFRRPCVFVNCVSLEYAITWLLGLFIPKKLWLREERRFLTLREILDSGVGRFVYSHEYEQLGIELIENTPEEITALVIEMDQRIEGTWQTTEEDEELQRRFWALFKPRGLNGVILSRIGAEFLRQNREWLD